MREEETGRVTQTTNNIIIEESPRPRQHIIISTAFIMSFSIGTSTTVANMETSVPKMDMALGKYVGRRVRGVVVVCFFVCLYICGRSDGPVSR
jgi:hypothetical protein